MAPRVLLYPGGCGSSNDIAPQLHIGNIICDIVPGKPIHTKEPTVLIRTSNMLPTTKPVSGLSKSEHLPLISQLPAPILDANSPTLQPPVAQRSTLNPSRFVLQNSQRGPRGSQRKQSQKEAAPSPPVLSAMTRTSHFIHGHPPMSQAPFEPGHPPTSHIASPAKVSSPSVAPRRGTIVVDTSLEYETTKRYVCKGSAEFLL